MKTSNLSADHSKKVIDLDGSTPESAIRSIDLDRSTAEPAIQSGDTGQWIPCFDSCQLIHGYYLRLITTLMCNQFPPGLLKWLESVKVNIGFPVVRTGGRSVYGHVITKFSGVGKFL